MCNGVRTVGPWSSQEQTMHINSLELLAAHLAVTCFAKNKTNLTISTPQDGQHISPIIHKQVGWNNLPTTKLHCQRAMAVEHSPYSPLLHCHFFETFKILTILFLHSDI